MKKNTTGKHWEGVIDAVKHNDFEAVKFWVEEKGANVTEKDRKKRQTAAHLAAAKDYVDILKYLLRHDKSTNVKKSLVKLKDADGLTVYHLAAQNGSINSLKYLADESKFAIDLLEPVDEHPNNNALHLAADNGHVEVLKYLIEEKHADVNSRNKLQEPPIFRATEFFKFPVVKYLVEQCKADPTLTDFKRNNILHCAAIVGNLDVPRFLLDDMKITFNLNARNDFGDTAVILAAKFNRSNVLKYLVEEKEADVNALDIQYQTPLYHAARFGYIDVVKHLVEHGANTTMRDKYGHRPVDAAATPDIKNYLKGKTPRARGRRSIGVTFKNPEPPIYTLLQETKIIDDSKSSLLQNAATTSLSNFSHFDSFLVLANTCVRYLTNMKYAH